MLINRKRDFRTDRAIKKQGLCKQIEGKYFAVLRRSICVLRSSGLGLLLYFYQEVCVCLFVCFLESFFCYCLVYCVCICATRGWVKPVFHIIASVDPNLLRLSGRPFGNILKRQRQSRLLGPPVLLPERSGRLWMIGSDQIETTVRRSINTFGTIQIYPLMSPDMIQGGGNNFTNCTKLIAVHGRNKKIWMSL